MERRAGLRGVRTQLQGEHPVDRSLHLISEGIKTSGDCIKEFGKFKGEFFALNEPIMNKDISSLSGAFVATQLDKQ